MRIRCGIRERGKSCRREREKIEWVKGRKDAIWRAAKCTCLELQHSAAAAGSKKGELQYSAKMGRVGCVNSPRCCVVAAPGMVEDAQHERNKGASFTHPRFHHSAEYCAVFRAFGRPQPMYHVRLGARARLERGNSEKCVN